jgi:hypothetical protein
MCELHHNGIRINRRRLRSEEKEMQTEKNTISIEISFSRSNSLTKFLHKIEQNHSKIY